jgi:RimJ/RimL family protein N-acetyltransferase
MVELLTSRLMLRPMRADDAIHIARLFAGDQDAVEQTGRMPYPPTEIAIRVWLRGHLQPDSHSFLILRGDDSEPLGGAGFGGTGPIAELGYSLGRAHWGQGYATEAAAALVEHARALGFAGLEAYSFLENPASARVLAKVGFHEQGVVERDYPRRGGLRPVRQHHLGLRGRH